MCFAWHSQNCKEREGKDCCWHNRWFVQFVFLPPRERWIVFYFFEFLAHVDRSVLWYDSSCPPSFPCILFWSSDMFVSLSWCAFSSCESMRESSIRPADEELFWQSAPRIRVNAQTSRCHFKMLFNSIKRAASASWSGLIWQQGISLDCHWALSTCLCLWYYVRNGLFLSLSRTLSKYILLWAYCVLEQKHCHSTFLFDPFGSLSSINGQGFKMYFLTVNLR